MQGKISFFSMLKVPLYIAFAVIVVRLILEFSGAPNAVSMIFGVAWLHILVPIYFALKISENEFEKPLIALIKITLLFSVIVRFAVGITYVLAHLFNWSIPRFAMVTNADVTPLMGYLVLPLSAFVFYVLITLLVGIITGGLTLLVKGKISKTKG